MGCFSFLCKECGKGIESSSIDGHRCKLFLLKNGKVIQQMEGEYDSYGSCFIDNTQDPSVKHALRESYKWNDPKPEQALSEEAVRVIGSEHAIWHRITDLMFSEDTSNGIAAVHEQCFKEIPTTRSKDDPNQGWGEYDETDQE